MAYSIRKINYFYTTVKDQPGEAYELLSQLSGLGISLLAFTAIPIGPSSTQFALFPDDDLKLKAEATRAGLHIDGPHPAFLVQGDDELGALSEVHHKFYLANVNIYASSGVSDGKGSYGYVVYVRPADFERAAEAMAVE
jgi:hypothetical protein